MHAPEGEQVFYATDVPSPSLDNRLFPHYFLKFIYEIYDGHASLPARSKVKLFFYILNPNSDYYYDNPESFKTARLEAPRNIVTHLKLNLLHDHPDGLCASKMKVILCETIEMFTKDWLWDMTPQERSFYERMLTEGWGR